MKYYNVQGSNQFVKQPKKRVLGTTDAAWIAVSVLLAIAAMGMYVRLVEVKTESKYLISPLTFYSVSQVHAEERTGKETLTYEEARDWNDMVALAERLAPIYDYPTSVLLGQMALESNYGRSNFCKERFNCFGIGAYTENPESAFYYENHAQGMIAYMQLIKQRYSKAYAQRENPERMIELIKEAGYATDPNYVSKVKRVMEDFK